MKISSLSLELASGQTQEFGAVTNRTSLKHRLKEMLNCAVFEEPTADGSTGLTMPMLMVQAKLRQREFTFSYDLLSKEEGLLSLFYTCDKSGEEHHKEFGFVSMSELEAHLLRLLSMSCNNFIEHYFPKNTMLEQLLKYSSITYLSAAGLGLLSFFFFCDLIWRDEFFDTAYLAVLLTYVITLPILLLNALSSIGRARIKQVGQSLVKQVFALLVGNIVLSFAFVAGGCNLLHVISAKATQIDVTFSDKRQDYWGKHCKGGVNIEHFSGTVCLEDRAYWKIIRPGMRAVAQGESSIVAFDVKAISLNTLSSVSQ